MGYAKLFPVNYLKCSLRSLEELKTLSLLKVIQSKTFYPSCKCEKCFVHKNLLLFK